MGMAGLTENQWNKVEKRLEKIDKTHDDVIRIKEFLGIDSGNGMRGRMKALEAKVEGRGQKTRVLVSWILAIILFLLVIYDRADRYLEKAIQRNQTGIMMTPGPTP